MKYQMNVLHTSNRKCFFKTFRIHTRIGPPQTFIEHAIYFLTDTDKKIIDFYMMFEKKTTQILKFII